VVEQHLLKNADAYFTGSGTERAKNAKPDEYGKKNGIHPVNAEPRPFPGVVVILGIPVGLKPREFFFVPVLIILCHIVFPQ
jgi:hypothetical protein